MSALARDVIGGFNTFVTDQAREPGRAHLTLVQFDSQGPFEIIHDSARIEDVPELTSDTYRPRGTTPLMDAIGDLIEHADPAHRSPIPGRSTGGRPIGGDL